MMEILLLKYFDHSPYIIFMRKELNIEISSSIVYKIVLNFHNIVVCQFFQRIWQNLEMDLVTINEQLFKR
jgi:phosphomannomutase